MRKRLFITAAILAIILSATATWIYLNRNPFPATIRESVATPLYYPRQLPDHFKLNPESFAAKRGLVIYHFTDPFGHHLNFTIQPLPKNFDPNEEFKKGLQNVKTVTTPYGPARIGTLGDNTIANLVVDHTWVMAVYDEPGYQESLTPVMQSLRRY